MTDPSTLRGLLAEATPGPWTPCGASNGRCQCGFVHAAAIDGPVAITAISEDVWPDFASGTPKSVAVANAALIATAVNALPGLLDEIEEAVELLHRSAPSVDADATWWEERRSRTDARDGEHHIRLRTLHGRLRAFLSKHPETP